MEPLPRPPPRRARPTAPVAALTRRDPSGNNGPMTVVLTGSALTLDELVRVARDGEAVALAPDVGERMARARRTVDAALAAATRSTA